MSLKLILTDHSGPVGVAPPSGALTNCQTPKLRDENHCGPIGRRVAFDMDAWLAPTSLFPKSRPDCLLELLGAGRLRPVSSLQERTYDAVDYDFI